MSSEAKLQEAHHKLLSVSEAVEDLSRTIAEGLRKVTLDDVERQLKHLNRSSNADRVLLFDMMEEQTLLIFVICAVMFFLCLFTCLYACNRSAQPKPMLKSINLSPFQRYVNFKSM